ncbi:MAG: FHA domain-containing protein [Christensenellaceae bacterium]|jgi:hypothetical protein|nr:FHA domain-containing protein [Christensenellaceae bacterium]
MPQAVYAFVVSLMRYFFIAIIVYILVRIVYHSLREYGELRRVKHWLSDGYAKYIEFLPPYADEEGGFVLVRSNLIGRSPRCDIFIDDHSLKRRHALLYERKGEEYIRPRRKASLWINGERPPKRTASLTDGDLVRLGNVTFLFKLRRAPLEAYDEQG